MCKSLQNFCTLLPSLFSYAFFNIASWRAVFQSHPFELVSNICIYQLTVNSMAEFFKTGKGVDLEVLTSATLMKLEEIKEKTASGKSFIC